MTDLLVFYVDGWCSIQMAGVLCRWLVLRISCSRWLVFYSRWLHPVLCRWLVFSVDGLLFYVDGKRSQEKDCSKMKFHCLMQMAAVLCRWLVFYVDSLVFYVDGWCSIQMAGVLCRCLVFYRRWLVFYIDGWLFYVDGWCLYVDPSLVFYVDGLVFYVDGWCSMQISVSLISVCLSICVDGWCSICRWLVFYVDSLVFYVDGWCSISDGQNRTCPSHEIQVEWCSMQMEGVLCRWLTVLCR